MILMPTCHSPDESAYVVGMKILTRIRSVGGRFFLPGTDLPNPALMSPVFATSLVHRQIQGWCLKIPGPAASSPTGITLRYGVRNSIRNPDQ